MKILAKVTYKGTNYQGWQKQTNAPSIQETIESAISKILNTPTTIQGSGRTDTGVHAKGQTFHFEVNKEVDLPRLRYSLNCVLPDDIHIVELKEVDNEFHARHSAIAKHYSYSIKIGESDPFLNDMVFVHHEEIDMDLFKQALQLFVGKHNYQDFTSKEEDEKQFVREIKSITVTEGPILKVDMVGNGFMRYMIRFIIGAALAVAEHREDIDFIQKHLDSETRNIINYKAPSTGLVLEEVIY